MVFKGNVFRLACAAFAALSLAAFLPASAAAASPLPSGAVGSDISWPQCGDPMPSAGSFAVLGVNGGAPFSGNLCMMDQYANAPRSAPPSLYLNTGYLPEYRYLVTSGCRYQAHSITGMDIEREAWAIGCSEAETSIKYAYALGASSISMWWLDVEIMNKWSLQLNLNRFTLQGAVTRLSETDLPVGIYSSPAMWVMITGVLALPGYLSAIWFAGGSCSRPFLPNVEVPVWLVQHTFNHLDHDWAC